MLARVKVFKYDTCYTYALKRIGFFDQFSKVESDEFIKMFIHYEISEVELGDLIVFDKKQIESAIVIIEKNGKTITRKVNFGLHFIVFEDKFVSYLSTRNKKRNIKVRFYEEIFNEQIKNSGLATEIFVIKNQELKGFK
jgi:hypothetical protein